jgi:kynurenine formamidase
MRWKQRPEGSNWGDFGPDDQAGRMNLVTPERRLAGVREVREGIAFTLSLPLDYPGPMIEMRKPPRLFVETIDGHPAYNQASDHCSDVMCDDGVVLYTQFSTQWDSLAHMGQKFDADGDGVAEKVYYNGYRADEHLLGPDHPEGPYAKALGIENMAVSGVQGRGVMLNFKAMFGPEYRWLSYDDVMRTIDTQQVDVQKGDFLLMHTGYDEAILSMNKQPDREKLALLGAGLSGKDEKLLHWIDDSGIVAICSDNLAVEAYDWDNPPGAGHPILPIHELCLFKLGIHLGELWQLFELAEWLRAHDRSAFLLTAPPLRLPGSVGSPATPIATV